VTRFRLAITVGERRTTEPVSLWSSTGLLLAVSAGEVDDPSSVYPGSVAANPKPVLAVDVDGVISLFGFEGGALAAPGGFHWVDGIAHCISSDVGPRLRRLAALYDLVWATGWEDRANDYLVHILELEGELPVLSFDGESPVFGTSHWKLGAIATYARDRPLAWIDDCIDEECQAWAESRPEPTLLVRTEPAVGLTDEHVERLIAWVGDGYTGRG
jgi:HAD domain in Swiss Army Knife RNA repair proteins